MGGGRVAVRGVRVGVAREGEEGCDISAEEAYMVAWAWKYRRPTLTLDKGRVQAGQTAGAELMGVE